mgnify:CR=1 FL=1
MSPSCARTPKIFPEAALIGYVVTIACTPPIYQATKYCSPALTVKATRPRYQRKLRNGRALSVIVTIGKPNFTERQFIKVYQRAGEPFPVKKLQVKRVSGA